MDAQKLADKASDYISLYDQGMAAFSFEEVLSNLLRKYKHFETSPAHLVLEFGNGNIVADLESKVIHVKDMNDELVDGVDLSLLSTLTKEVITALNGIASFAKWEADTALTDLKEVQSKYKEGP